ncbi:MAG: hypothetical protein NTY90_03645 [Candidatus Micrarchaeota archaeon]|nr:hypothetical protein [Candidatus Micrarchaeota archaeon]
MVLRELVEKHFLPIKQMEGQSVHDVGEEYYKRLAPFRKELDSTHYDLEQELPALAELVREKFPESLTKTGAHTFALSAFTRSIGEDFLVKKAHADPEKRKIIHESFKAYTARPDETAADDTARELRQKLGKDAADTVKQMDDAATRLMDFLRERQKKADQQTNALIERFNNSMTDFRGFSSTMHVVFKNEKRA